MTAARAAIALLVPVVVVLVFASRSQGVDAELLASMLMPALPVLLWLVPFGLLIDHFGARLGLLTLGAVHLVGMQISTTVTYLGLLVWAIITNQPLGGPLALVLMLLVAAVGTGLVYLLAWAVPGSFPRRQGLGWSAIRGVRAVARFIRDEFRRARDPQPVLR